METFGRTLGNHFVTLLVISRNEHRNVLVAVANAFESLTVRAHGFRQRLSERVSAFGVFRDTADGMWNLIAHPNHVTHFFEQRNDGIVKVDGQLQHVAENTIFGDCENRPCNLNVAL